MQHPIRRRWPVSALAALGLAVMVTVGWTVQALADPGGWDEHGEERGGWLGRQPAVVGATAQDRSGLEPIRQVPRATMPEPLLDHGRQFGGDGPVPVQVPADPARPAKAGAQPSRIIGLALAGLALAAGVVWVGRRRLRRWLLGLAVLLGCSVMGAPAVSARPTLAGTQGTVWVTNQTLNTVAAYDASTGDLLRMVKVGAKPIGVVAPPGTGAVYVSNESDDTISVIDEATDEVLTIPVGDGPHHMVHSMSGRFVYFGEFNANTVGAINTRDHSYRHFVASASPTAKTHAVWIGRGGRTLYAVNSEADTFTAVGAVTGAPRWFDVPVGDQPSEVLVTPNARTAYISIRGEDKIGIFSLAGARPRKVGEVVVGDQPDTLQLTPDRRILVVATRGTFTLPGGPAARVDLVDTRSLQATPVFIQGATTTGHQWLSPDGRYTYVAIESAPGLPLPPGVAVIDNRVAEVVATWAYPGGGRPHGVYFEPGRPCRQRG